MKNRFLGLLAIFALTSLAAFGADIDGKWTADAGGKGGPQTLTLKASGMTLTGALEGRRGPSEISEGMVHGSDVTFKIVRDMGDKGKMTQAYQGKLDGDSLNLTVTSDFGGGPQTRDMTFKRAK